LDGGCGIPCRQQGHARDACVLSGKVLDTLLRVQARLEQSQQDEEHGAFADDSLSDDDDDGDGDGDDGDGDDSMLGVAGHIKNQASNFSKE